MALPRSKTALKPEPVVAESPLAREIARPIMPTIPGRTVALNRAGKPVQRAAAETGVDEFFIPRHLPPPGWSWEWKEETVLGEIRQGYAAKLAQVGWEPVMTETYPGIFTPEYDAKGSPAKGPVRRGGLILMERAMTLTQEAKRDEKRKADERIGSAKSQYTRLDTTGTHSAEAAEQISYIRQKSMPVNFEPDMATPVRSRQPID